MLEIIDTILILLINFLIIYSFYKKRYKLLIFSLLPLMIFFLINYINDKDLFIIMINILFSFIIIFFSIISNITFLNKNLSKEIKIDKIRTVFLMILMPILITSFQLNLIWDKDLQKDILIDNRNTNTRVKSV